MAHVGEDVRHAAGPELAFAVPVPDGVIEIVRAESVEVDRPDPARLAQPARGIVEIELRPDGKRRWPVAESGEPEQLRGGDVGQPADPSRRCGPPQRCEGLLVGPVDPLVQAAEFGEISHPRLRPGPRTAPPGNCGACRRVPAAPAGYPRSGGRTPLRPSARTDPGRGPPAPPRDGRGGRGP